MPRPGRPRPSGLATNPAASIGRVAFVPEGTNTKIAQRFSVGGTHPRFRPSPGGTAEKWRSGFSRPFGARGNRARWSQCGLMFLGPSGARLRGAPQPILDFVNPKANRLFPEPLG